MKAYRIEILVIDFDELGLDGVRREIENARYPNRCISTDVQAVEEADIGDWSDDHPLNNSGKAAAEYMRLFPARAAIQGQAGDAPGGSDV